jgi:3-(3-hydroxy-phenyl)propionate hydroxylase
MARADIATSEASDVDIAIVGFGPVGAVAACIFGQAGLRAHVIDSATTIYDKPRAVALDHEIARILQGLGLAEALEACSEPFTDSVYLGANGGVIKRLTMLPEPHPQGWTPSMVILQPRLEEAVRMQVRRQPCVSVALGRTLVGLHQDEDRVTLEIDGPSGREACAARYVIGCDGAGSTTRKLAGLALDDLGFDEPWLVVDILANERGLAKLPRTSVQYCEPKRPTTFVICTGGHRRWEFRLKEGEDPRAMESPAAVWSLLSRWITPEDATLWRSASYRFHALVGHAWRDRRVFIAGDAAHQQPPFLGQGLCQGIRDVANLGWKLAARLAGEAGDALLDTYGPERCGHVSRLTGAIKGIGRLIGERDPVAAAARDDRLVREAGGRVLPVPRQDLMPALAEGFISRTATSARGTLFPQPWLMTPTGARRMDDVAGGGFRLVSNRSAGRELTESIRMLGWRMIQISERGATEGLQERDGVVQAWLESHGARYALVRPDHYVFGTAMDADGALALVREASTLAGAR